MKTANQIKSSVELSPPHFTSRSPIHFGLTAFLLPSSEFRNIFINISCSLVISVTFSFKLDKYSSILWVQNPRIQSCNTCVSNFDNIHPIKNMTWILMKIPCHFSSQIDGSLVQIHTKFHDYSMSFIQVYLFSMHKHDTDFLMSFWRQFGLVRKWDQVREKSRHFFSKWHGNSWTWTCPKSMSCSSMENKYNLDKWHGMVMEFGVDSDQTATKSSCDDVKWLGISMRYHIFYRANIIFHSTLHHTIQNHINI